jgi:hypothetical protein
MLKEGVGTQLCESLQQSFTKYKDLFGEIDSYNSDTDLKHNFGGCRYHILEFILLIEILQTTALSPCDSKTFHEQGSQQNNETPMMSFKVLRCMFI